VTQRIKVDLPPAASRPSRPSGLSGLSGPFCPWEAAGAPGPAPGNRSQIVTGSQKHRDPRHLPYAFAEHGAIMAATVLNSPRAVQMSVFVVRAFVKMRAVLTDTRELARKLAVASRPSRPSGLFGPFCPTEASAASATPARAAPAGNRLPRQRRRRALPPQAKTGLVWGRARRRGVSGWPTLGTLRSQIVISSWGGQHPLQRTRRLEKTKANLKGLGYGG
jgi:hypothetical protein